MGNLNQLTAPVTTYPGVFDMLGENDHQPTLGFGDTANSLRTDTSQLGQKTPIDFTLPAGNFPVQSWVFSWAVSVPAQLVTLSNANYGPILFRVHVFPAVFDGPVSLGNAEALIPAQTGATPFVHSGAFRIDARVAFVVIEHVSALIGNVQITWDVFARAVRQ